MKPRSGTATTSGAHKQRARDPGARGRGGGRGGGGWGLVVGQTSDTGSTARLGALPPQPRREPFSTAYACIHTTNTHNRRREPFSTAYAVIFKTKTHNDAQRRTRPIFFGTQGPSILFKRLKLIC